MAPAGKAPQQHTVQRPVTQLPAAQQPAAPQAPAAATPAPAAKAPTAKSDAELFPVETGILAQTNAQRARYGLRRWCSTSACSVRPAGTPIG